MWWGPGRGKKFHPNLGASPGARVQDCPSPVPPPPSTAKGFGLLMAGGGGRKTSSKQLQKSSLSKKEGVSGGGARSGADLTDLSFPNCFPVAFLSKPQGLVTPKKKGNGNKRRKGKGLGKKRDPCLRKYKDFCIHGECKYIRELGAPSCICQPGYHGERCHGLLLPVEHPPSAYDHTTALAVVAVVLSSLCLVIIAALLMLRCHKRGGYDVENEEKIKLGITVNH
uniref:Proheparin-binding EGF-like growth factor n=1 Tax=Zonotrichia albicollis TaxID=44394 RepID=A0A8D2NGS8_ZONAL